ncbi:MAG: hypothetical protein GX358_06940 [candidate division WS1 bacterium]|nr:hypothetical protein [candidate division WS1 bacterium]
MAYSFIDLAEEVLENVKKPLTYLEIWEAGEESGLADKVGSKGNTPWLSVGSQLYVDVRDNPDSVFIKIGRWPARFFLKARESELSSDVVLALENAAPTSEEESTPYCELDLHPLLAYFVYANPSFNHGRAIYTKTIHHEISQQSGYSEWSHPDMVGFQLSLDDWSEDVFELNKLTDNNALRLYSFELKKSLDQSNYRKAFFQAVSNSSWAHEGYLVAADIPQYDDLLMSELQRLTSAFGIGILQLDLDDIDASSILFPARARDGLDWETINKLCYQNADFKGFLQSVNTAFVEKCIDQSGYDEVLEDPQDYIAQLPKSGHSHGWDSNMIDVPGIMVELAQSRPIFHSEADFQHALAWSIREAVPGCNVRLEKPFTVNGNRIYADIWVSGPDGQELIEVKYKTRQLTANLGDEDYLLKEQSAQNQGRCDVCKDIWRVEQFCSSVVGGRGWVLLLTNDSAYWSPPASATPVDAADAAFRLHEENTIGGVLSWGSNASAGTTEGRATPIELAGSYLLRWQPFSQLDMAGYSEFRFLAIRVPAQ